MYYNSLQVFQFALTVRLTIARHRSLINQFHLAPWNEKLFARLTLSRKFLPELWEETANRVVTPNVVRPGTESTSIQNETHEMATISMVGK